VLVERLVAVMAPVTQEIARRSPSASELVLKRLVSGGRREEIFVAKAELVKRLDGLEPQLRTVFDPLGLGDGSAAAGGVFATSRSSGPAEAAAPHGSPEPPTLVMAKRSSPSQRPGDPSRAGDPSSSAAGPSVDAGWSDNVSPGGQHES
jgi:hypothetical protein